MKSREKFMKKPLVVWIGAMICCGLWGSAFPCIKIGYRMFGIGRVDTASQILFAGYRFTLAGILTIVIGSLLERKILLPGKKSAGMILRLSMLQTVIQYLFFYIGLANTTGVKASIVGGTNVFVAILVASLVFCQEKLTLKKTAGCLMGFCGVVIVNLNGIDMQLNVKGEGFIFISAIAYAFSSVFLKRYSRKENPVLLSGWQFFTGGILMSICGAAMGGKVEGFTTASSVMLLYMALISAVAYSLWGILLKYNPVSRVAVFGFMNPVFGVVFSALLLGETGQAGYSSIAALVLVCAGIWMVNRPEKVDVYMQ